MDTKPPSWEQSAYLVRSQHTRHTRAPTQAITRTDMHTHTCKQSGSHMILRVWEHLLFAHRSIWPLPACWTAKCVWNKPPTPSSSCPLTCLLFSRVSRTARPPVCRRPSLPGFFCSSSLVSHPYFLINIFLNMCYCSQSPSCVWLFATPGTIAHQALCP